MRAVVQGGRQGGTEDARKESGRGNRGGRESDWKQRSRGGTISRMEGMSKGEKWKTGNRQTNRKAGREKRHERGREVVNEKDWGWKRRVSKG